MRGKTGIFLVTSTNVTILIFLVLSKTAFGFKGVIAEIGCVLPLRYQTDFFMFILCLTGFCIRDKSSEGHTTCLFEIFELFFIIRPDVPKKNIAHATVV